MHMYSLNSWKLLFPSDTQIPTVFFWCTHNHTTPHARARACTRTHTQTHTRYTCTQTHKHNTLTHTHAYILCDSKHAHTCKHTHTHHTHTHINICMLTIYCLLAHFILLLELLYSYTQTLSQSLSVPQTHTLWERLTTHLSRHGVTGTKDNQFPPSPWIGVCG